MEAIVYRVDKAVKDLDVIVEREGESRYRDRDAGRDNMVRGVPMTSFGFKL